MSSFDVDAPALKDLVGLLSRAQQDVRACSKYVAPIEQLESGSGRLNEGVHQATFETLSSWLGKLVDPTLANTKEAVGNARKYYLATDRASAERFDRTQLPETDVVAARKEAGYLEAEKPENRSTAGVFDDLLEPQSKLVEGDKSAFEDQDMMELSWYEAFSISAIMNEAVEEATRFLAWIGLLDRAYNPLDELFKPYVGDWAGVRAAAVVLFNLSEALFDSYYNLKWASQGVEKVWEGNAGDAASVYLMDLAISVDSSREPIRKLSEAYQTAAVEMVKYRDACTGLYKSIVDGCIELAAAGAVAGGSTSTGIGAPVGGAAALYATYKGIRIVSNLEKLFGYVNNFFTAVDVWQAAHSDFGAVDGQLALPKPLSTGMKLPG